MKIFVCTKLTLKQLASLYEKTPRSFATWIEPLKEEVGPKLGWDYTPAQVRIIVAHLGPPPGYELNETDKILK